MIDPSTAFSPCLAKLLDRSPLLLAPTENLRDACRRIRERGYGIIDEPAEIPRIFTLVDGIRAIDSFPDRTDLTVGEAIDPKQEYLSVRDYEDIFVLALDLKRKNSDYIPFLDDDGHCIGVITPDRFVAASRDLPMLHSIRFSEILDSRVVTATPDTPVREVIRLMSEHRTDRVVIIDGGRRPVGYLSAADAIEFSDRRAGECSRPARPVKRWETIGDALDRWKNEAGYLLAIGGDGTLAGSIGYREYLQSLHPKLLYRSLESQKERASQSEEQLRLILDNAPSYIYIIDERGIIHFINRVPEGMTREEVIGHHTAEAVRPESRPVVHEAIDRVFRTGETVTYEKSGLGNNNQLAHYQTKMARFDHPKLGKAAIVITTDITDLKTTELALRETEEQFRQLAETLPEVFFIYNLDPYECLYISPAFERMTGFPCRELYENGAFWLSRVHPDDRSRIEKAVWQEIEGYPVDEEYRAFHADGRTIWARNRSFPIADDRGRYTRTVGFVEDITAAKNLEADRERLKIAIEQVSQGIAAYTGEDFFASLVRYLAEALRVDIVFIGELIEADSECLQMIAVYGDGTILPNFDCNAANSPCQTVIGRRVQHYPDRVRARFPRAAILQDMEVEGYLGIPLWTADNRPLGILGVFHRSPLHDISLPIDLLKIFAVRAGAELERRAATKALERLNRELESRVARRTRELEVLLKEIHHRVKNNLNVMSHLLDWQARLIPDPDTRAIFQESHARIQTMALIHDQLYQADNFVRVNLANYIERLVNNIFITYGDGTGRYQFSLDLQPIDLDVDKAIPCGLILNELLTNAFKYAFPDNRNGKIEIHLFRTHHPSIHIKVSDNGIGIPDEIEWSSSDTLGLKLIKILTHQLDGMIEFERGEGTCFYLIFPL
jgi:PAS domain S-box-containing protein